MTLPCIRFQKPFTEAYRSAVIFFFIVLAVLLRTTYFHHLNLMLTEGKPQ